MIYCVHYGSFYSVHYRSLIGVLKHTWKSELTYLLKFVPLGQCSAKQPVTKNLKIHLIHIFLDIPMAYDMVLFHSVWPPPNPITTTYINHIFTTKGEDVLCTLYRPINLSGHSSWSNYNCGSWWRLGARWKPSRHSTTGCYFGGFRLTLLSKYSFESDKIRIWFCPGQLSDNCVVKQSGLDWR